MEKNNFFNHIDSGRCYAFLNYLMSFAMEQHEDEDPLLSECAKELIRYILNMNQDENIIVTTPDEDIEAYVDDEDIEAYVDEDFAVLFLVNHNRYIRITPYSYGCDINKEYYNVIFNPAAGFGISKTINTNTIYLSIKKLIEIFSKYQSKNQLFIQFLQFLDEQEQMIQETLQKPIKQWNYTEYRYFTLHLVEDSIVDVNKSLSGLCTSYDSYKDIKFWRSLKWYYISNDELNRMGCKNIQIYLYTNLNTINIYIIPYDKKAERYVEKIEDFISNNFSVPITFDLNNYKEKFKYAESIMDRLKNEFRI